MHFCLCTDFVFVRCAWNYHTLFACGSQRIFKCCSMPCIWGNCISPMMLVLRVAKGSIYVNFMKSNCLRNETKLTPSGSCRGSQSLKEDPHHKETWSLQTAIPYRIPSQHLCMGPSCLPQAYYLQSTAFCQKKVILHAVHHKNSWETLPWNTTCVCGRHLFTLCPQTLAKCYRSPKSGGLQLFLAVKCSSERTIRSYEWILQLIHVDHLRLSFVSASKQVCSRFVVRQDLTWSRGFLL
jgi:hypothetical protein